MFLLFEFLVKDLNALSRTQVAKVAVAADPALVRAESATPRSSPEATARKTRVEEAEMELELAAAFEKQGWKIAGQMQFKDM